MTKTFLHGHLRSVGQMLLGRDDGRKHLLHNRQWVFLLGTLYLIGVLNALLQYAVDGLLDIWMMLYGLLFPAVGLFLTVGVIFVGMHGVFQWFFSSSRSLAETVYVPTSLLLVLFPMALLINVLYGVMGTSRLAGTAIFEAVGLLFGVVSLLLFVWVLVATVYHLSRLHEVGYGQGTIGVFLPVVLLVLFTALIDAVITLLTFTSG